MVNKIRVQQAIDIMERAKAKGSVFMPHYQSVGELEAYSDSEEGLHQCGNKACFAGHVAVSPEFSKDGGRVGGYGSPIFLEYHGAAAIRNWLECSRDLAKGLVYGHLTDDISVFYGNKPWADVSADDVIEKLKLVLKGELE